jgi:hypothetical protein
VTAATTQERSAFYRAAVLGLRALDARDSSARRLGADAEARWTQFAGALGLGDRIDILLRDASITWGAAFSPSECFNFFALAEDEPFGPDWQSVDDGTAKRLLAEHTTSATPDEAANILGVASSPLVIPPLTPATKVVVAGGVAIAEVARAFADRSDLSWSDQVLVVADKGAFRQLSSLVAVLQGARARTSLIRSGTGGARAVGFPHLDLAVVSDDAEPACAELARSLGGQ